MFSCFFSGIVDRSDLTMYPTSALKFKLYWNLIHMDGSAYALFYPFVSCVCRFCNPHNHLLCISQTRPGGCLELYLRKNEMSL